MWEDFCEYSGQNILFANKDTFLDKQGSYLLMNIIVLWYHQLEKPLYEEYQDWYVIVLLFTGNVPRGVFCEQSSQKTRELRREIMRMHDFCASRSALLWTEWTVTYFRSENNNYSSDLI